MSELVDGTWYVRTESSAYFVDVDEMTIHRLPGQGLGAAEGTAVVLVERLRKDGDVIPLLAKPDVEVGLPMMLFLDIRGDGVETCRITTEVRSARRLLDMDDLPSKFRVDLT